MKKQEITYKLNNDPSSLKEIEQDFRIKNKIGENVKTIFYKINVRREKFLLDDEYLQNRKNKKLVDKTIDILVEVIENEFEVYI
jgi:hypothetical protein